MNIEQIIGHPVSSYLTIEKQIDAAGSVELLKTRGGSWLIRCLVNNEYQTLSYKEELVARSNFDVLCRFSESLTSNSALDR